MKVKLLRRHRFNDTKVITAGTILEVRPHPNSLTPALAPYQIIEGEFASYIIERSICVELPEEPSYTLAKYTEVHQELLQRREEVKHYRTEIDRLRQLVDEKAKEERRMFKEAERLQGDVVKLLRELKEAKEAKKVVLPREVAEAIEVMKKDDFSNLEIIQALVPYPFERGEHVQKAIDCINDFITVDADYLDIERCDLLMEALVNDYTVEEPEVTPKQKAIQYLIKTEAVARGKSAHDVVTAVMSILGTEQSG